MAVFADCGVGRIRGAQSVMKNNGCFWEKLYNFSMGFIFFMISLYLMVLGSSTLPVLGFILAAPTLWLAFRYYGKAPSVKGCE
jgi:hypothetical protein